MDFFCHIIVRNSLVPNFPVFSIAALNIYVKIFLLFQAQYTLPTADFDVDTSFFPSGGYHVKGSISMNGQMTGCLDIYFTVN